jgi:hypothetical protein
MGRAVLARQAYAKAQAWPDLHYTGRAKPSMRRAGSRHDLIHIKNEFCYGVFGVHGRYLEEPKVSFNLIC